MFVFIIPNSTAKCIQFETNEVARKVKKILSILPKDLDQKFMQSSEAIDTEPKTISPVPEGRPVLVLDLDETCIYSTPAKPEKQQNFPIRIKRRNVFIQVRPGMQECIRRLSEKYEIFFYTASTKIYANKVIDAIAPFVDNEHRFFVSRDQLKDLTLINRPLGKVLLLDNSACSAQKNNLLLIKTWIGDPNDNAFTNEVMPLLDNLVKESDIPSACRNLVSSRRYPSLYVIRS